MDKSKQRKYFKRFIICSLAIYIIVFLLHFSYNVYNYITYLKQQEANGNYTYTQGYYQDPYINNSQFSPDIFLNSDITSSYVPNSKLNIASGRSVQTVITSTGSTKNVSVDQKYEKTASITSETVKFDDEQKKLRDIIKQQKAVIQQENRNGLEGAQQLYLVIGVAPDNFDKLVEDLRAVGTLKSFSVAQVDKTEEYLQMKAARETLEATKESYASIKDLAETVDERIALEEKIITIDSEIRTIDIGIGMFSDEYSFCTVKIELREVVEVEVVSSYSVDFFYIAELGLESLIFALQVCGILLVILCGILIVGVVLLASFNYITNRLYSHKDQLGKTKTLEENSSTKPENENTETDKKDNIK